MNRSAYRTFACIAGVASVFVFLQVAWTEPSKRRITVADTIRMTSMSETTYAAADESTSRFARFSPNGKKFVVITQKGNPETNENEFSLLLFDAAEVYRTAKPKVLVSMRSRSNRAGIRTVKWVSNESLVFLGEARDTSQVYLLDMIHQGLKRLTNHPTPVVDFDFNADLQEIVYAAETSQPSAQEAYDRCAHGIVITNQALDDIPRSMKDCREPSLLAGEEVYVQKDNRPAVRVRFTDRYLTLKPISIGPSGRYALFGVLLRRVPPEWKEYEDPQIRAEATAFRNRGPYSWLSAYMLLDIETMQVRPIISEPIDGITGAWEWSPDGRTVAISGAFLPLNVSDSLDRSSRKAHPFVVEVDLATGKFVEISDQNLIASSWSERTNELRLRTSFRALKRQIFVFRKTAHGWTKEAAPPGDGKSLDRPEVTLEQDMNTPPKLYANDRDHSRQVLLLDLNPQFDEFEFGHVERITWRAKDGHEVEGGLYLPPDYHPGIRYPLVIQTHGFSKDEFWINGPWNSAFAAQPLAARDIVVLQVGHATERGADGKVQGTPEEAPRQMSAYEGAIDYLDDRGIIDRNRVGIIGFSRTQYYVEYALTHSPYRFAAATVADGFDGGYLQYLVNPYAKRDWMTVNGGDPFDATFDLWKERSPSFTVDRLHTPIRLEGYGGIAAVLGNWEWYAKLILLDRPVDMIYLPGGTHLLVKPWERLTSQQGNVDWFCFWLKGERNPDPRLRDQYDRWDEMRELQAKSTPRNDPRP